MLLLAAATASLPAAGHWSTDDMAYSTFKMYLCHISSIFEGVRMPWNTAYNNVRNMLKSDKLFLIFIVT
jgi:hypothetical protein